MNAVVRWKIVERHVLCLQIIYGILLNLAVSPFPNAIVFALPRNAKHGLPRVDPLFFPAAPPSASTIKLHPGLDDISKIRSQWRFCLAVIHYLSKTSVVFTFALEPFRSISEISLSRTALLPGATFSQYVPPARVHNEKIDVGGILETPIPSSTWTSLSKDNGGGSSQGSCACGLRSA